MIRTSRVPASRSMLAAAVALAMFTPGCASTPEASPPSVDTPEMAGGMPTRPGLPASASPQSAANAAGYAEAQSAAVTDTADALLSGLSRLCGQAFAGEVEVDVPATAAAASFAGKPLVMHVRECTRDAVRVPFHVGDDRSRTWVFTRTADGLRLKHDHRHADGSPDAITLYGGDAGAAFTGAAAWRRVAFPVDAESVAMFQAGGLAASVRNTWAVELSGNQFVYELSRPDGRLFRVVFDLTRPVPAPPPPWGG